ncbi:ATP-dependent DNA ligase [Arthrobacter sp. 9MFCol3.1]|uniref:ATP-dependent DNA ligase n=1 Tax=Arthrobacter sp. 9MFCol3.1 TaxID=1150398 RepID=UPI00047B7D12|nr:ATP-dependent DNA ligase [Arthrobacter sp. 9MFCol3.1]
MHLPLMPPIAPMLAKALPALPSTDAGTGWLFEPKWDGFRSIIFRDGDEVEIGSRNGKPMTRYFPELVEALKSELPERCVVDGEIILVAASGDRLDFDALQQRIHPAASRVKLLAEQTPARFVAFDLLALGDEDLTGKPFSERRRQLERALGASAAPVHVTAATSDRDTAQRWFRQFEGAGLDGIVAKTLEGSYQPDKRAMVKVKHERTADCVLAGYRVHTSGPDRIGSLLLGLYDDAGVLANVGVVGAFPMARRAELFAELQELVTGFDGHPWAWARQEEGARTPRKAEGSRWSGGKDLSFTPLRPERVVEVKYDHMEGERFRHTAQFLRWRPDRDPRSCTYDQLEEPVKFDLAAVLGAAP